MPGRAREICEDRQALCAIRRRFSRDINPLTPRPNDRRSDNFSEVEFTCEVSAVSVALFLIHAVLKQRTKDFRANFAPVVVARCFVQSIRFRALQLDWIDNLK